MSTRDVASGAINLAIPSEYAAIYVRVSTEDQGKGYSIPTQIEACQKLADGRASQ
jgi:Resolvase, N terminal domain